MQAFALSHFAARQSSRSAHLNTHTLLPLFPQLFTSKLFESLACQPVKMAPSPAANPTVWHAEENRRPADPLPGYLHLLLWKLLDMHEFLRASWSTGPERFGKEVVGRKPLSQIQASEICYLITLLQQISACAKGRSCGLKWGKRPRLNIVWQLAPAFLSVAVRLWLEISRDLALVGMVNV